MPDPGPILANLVSMDLEQPPRGFNERERFKAFRLHPRPSLSANISPTFLLSFRDRTVRRAF